MVDFQQSQSVAPIPQPVPQPVPLPVSQPIMQLPPQAMPTPMPIEMPTGSVEQVPPLQQQQGDNIFADVSTGKNLDVTAIITTRLNAMRKLQDNPLDTEALKLMYNTQKDVSAPDKKKKR